jgi:DNA-binding NarL/FixJ family response regulator
MSEPIRVVIADEHRLFREGLRLILDREKIIEIVGEAATRQQTIRVIKRLKPDVVLLDIALPEIDGVEVIRGIRQESPKTKPLMLITGKDETMIFKALQAGAKGYVSKDVGISDLIKAVQAVHQGDFWVERKLIARFFDGKAVDNLKGQDQVRRTKEELTPREEEVLRCTTRGWTNKEIAQALFISEKTVKSHLNSIFKKLNVTRRLQAILYAIQRGLK